MDLTWIDERLAVGGGIWTEDRMDKVSQAGITHIIDMQVEFDDTELAEPYGIRVLWSPVDDDFQPKPSEIFWQGVEFAREALEESDGKLFIHCAAGVHRAPMMALAILRSRGLTLEAAERLLKSRRPVVDLADVYVESVEEFMKAFVLRKG